MTSCRALHQSLYFDPVTPRTLWRTQSCILRCSTVGKTWTEFLLYVSAFVNENCSNGASSGGPNAA